ncbi:MAG: hypothetical protein Q4A35_03125 [Candidatus Gracilibacteria bacterium]|nr:hypothetical protein [Candidatus Gracilibacteria bacterium]
MIQLLPVDIAQKRDDKIVREIGDQQVLWRKFLKESSVARARPNPEKNNFSSHILEAIHIFTDEWFEFELPRILAVQFKSSDDCDEIRKKFDRYVHNYEIFLQNILYTLRSVDDYCADMAIAEELRRPYWSEYHHKKFQNFVESNIGKEEIGLPRAWEFFGKLKK